MLFTIFLMCFITAYLCFYSVFKTIYKNKNVVSARLNNIAKDDYKEKNDILNQSLVVRVINPLLDNLSKTILKITPKEMISSLEKKVLTGGAPYGLTCKDWINMQVVILSCLPLLTVVIGYLKGIEAKKIFLYILIEIGIGLLLPNQILNKSVTARKKKIISSMPDILDLLTVSVEAGLGFDGALAKVIDKMHGPLADEFENVLQEIKVGKKKRDALKDMANRVCVQDLSTFIGSIIQADQLGVSIGNVLRIQSEQMRQKRRQRIQEKAMKAPVKMLIPMIMFILPTIFSVLLGPVVIRALETFRK